MELNLNLLPEVPELFRKEHGLYTAYALREGKWVVVTPRAVTLYREKAQGAGVGEKVATEDHYGSPARAMKMVYWWLLGGLTESIDLY